MSSKDTARNEAKPSHGEGVLNSRFLLLIICCYSRKEQDKFPEALKGAEVKSLLKKFLTEDVFDELKVKKTTRGCTLWDQIVSGVEQLDSSNGVYATDEEAYTVFAKIFDPIIEAYHAPYKLADKHSSDMNPEKVDAPNLDPEGAFIRSTRIRVARNLKGHGLPPNLLNKERIEVENKVRLNKQSNVLQLCPA